jgi:hypothetical protein
MVAPDAYLERARQEQEAVRHDVVCGVVCVSISVCALPELGQEVPLHTRYNSIYIQNLPERSRDSIGPCDVRRLKKGSGPGPLTHDDTGCQTGLDHTPSSAK